MFELKPSTWAIDRFGAAAADLAQAVPLAIHRAHDRAMAAHHSSGLTTNDAYGSTLAVTQHLQLVELTRSIPGVVARKPVDVHSRYELLVLDETRVVLYPWRYATDHTRTRQDAKLRPPVSDLRKNLLTLTARAIEGQLNFDQAGLTFDQLEAELAEEQAVVEQLAKFGQVVTIGYASNPAAGIFDLGWGDAELDDEDTGTVIWHHWEPLSVSWASGTGGSTRAPQPSLSQVDIPERAKRFDDAPLNEDFHLRPRSPLTEPPTSEPERQRPETGSDTPESTI